MIWRVEVAEKKGYYDAVGASVKRDIHDLGLHGKVKDVKTVQVYLLEGDVPEHDVKRICENLLIDPVTQDHNYRGGVLDEKGCKVVEVAYNPGVMDPVEESAKKAIVDLGIRGVRTVKTAKKYLIRGSLSYGQIHTIADKVLYNKVIQHIVKGAATIAPEPPPYTFALRRVAIRTAGDDKLKALSKAGQLFLSLDEMRAIRAYFRKLKRDPTDCELETLAQTWSEHCKHKTFRGLIEYSAEGQELRAEGQGKTKKADNKPQLIDNLLKQTVMKVTAELKKPWCVSVFKDNSGIIRFDEKNNICFKVETHNHP